ncbi:glycosyltransferase family 4 protein [Natrialbaceae archaeon A-CW1-1]
MAEKKHITYIINSLHMGGAQVGLCRLIDGLDRESYEVTILAINGVQKEIIDRLPAWPTVLNLDRSVMRTCGQLRSMISAIRSADVIVGSLFHAVLAARVCGIINRGASVLTWQHSRQFKSTRRRQLYTLTEPLSDVHLADSQPVGEMLVNELGLKSEKVHVVPIAGIRLSDYEPVVHEGKEDLIVGSVGQLSEAKNYRSLLDVAEQLADTSLEFRVAGDGSLLDELLYEVENRGLSNVSFLGDLANVPQFLSNCDIYFQPSKREGLCISVLEAMATSLPIVGSDVGGIGQNVVHGESGFLYEPYDIDGFANSICNLMANPTRRLEFGSTGRKLVRECYTQEVLINEFEYTIQLQSHDLCD